MAEKSFALNTEPHVATVGTHRFEFQPEVIGAEFAAAYSSLKAAQAKLKAAGGDIGEDELVSLTKALRKFLRKFMLDESAQRFDLVKLPDRVLIQLMTWTAELYGGGSGNVPTGSSGAS